MRLSIIDLPPTGPQQMANADGMVWTVFNGEIYNHRELRRQLAVRGRVFKGRSDTEVLPHLYEGVQSSCASCVACSRWRSLTRAPNFAVSSGPFRD